MAATIEASKKILKGKRVSSRRSSAAAGRKRAEATKKAAKGKPAVPKVSKSKKIKRTNTMKDVIKEGKKFLKRKK